ncbi:MAG: hypothetical protein WAV28_02260 [Sedimentisphaerales bacterium]
MTINLKNPEDVLKPQFVQQYKELHEDIWHRLIETNTTITIIERIRQFPFRHFYPPYENVFWETVYWNFLYIATVFISAMVNDKSPDAHTLRRFKNNVHQWLKDSEKTAYSHNLKKLKFDQTTKNILQKTADMRNRLLAHRLFDQHGCLSNPEGVTVSEIRRAYNAIEKIFFTCSFGSEYVTTFYLDGTCAGKPIEKDIDKLLDLIVKNSNWLNQPEFMKEHWPEIRQEKSEEELRDLNTWRKKLGKPPA